MKKNFNDPVMLISRFDEEDIITSSFGPFGPKSKKEITAVEYGNAGNRTSIDFMKFTF